MIRVVPAEDDPERDGTTRVEPLDELDDRGTARDATPERVAWLDEPDDRDGNTCCLAVAARSVGRVVVPVLVRGTMRVPGGACSDA